MLKFPVSPIEGQIYTYDNVRKYIYSAGRWKVYSNNYVLAVENVNFANEPYVDAKVGAEAQRANQAIAEGDTATLTSAKAYADTKIVNDPSVYEALISQGDAATLASANAHSDTQAANALQAAQTYSDALVAGQDIKKSVTVATTQNIALSGVQTIDGYALSVGNTVLVKDQANGAQNGIYVVAAGAWARRNDADTSDKVTTGLTVTSEQGSSNHDTTWVLTTKDVVLGTSPLSFTIFGSSVSVDNITLRKTDNVVSVSPSVTPYDIGAYVNGKPNAADVITRIICVRPFNLPANLTGSHANASTPPSFPAVFTIKKNGVSIGSFQFAAGAGSASFTFAAPVFFATNDLITVHSPDTQDATLADIAFTFMGNLQ